MWVLNSYDYVMWFVYISVGKRRIWKTRKKTKLTSHYSEITIVNIFIYFCSVIFKVEIFLSLSTVYFSMSRNICRGKRKKPQESLKCLPEMLHLLSEGAEIQSHVFLRIPLLFVSKTCAVSAVAHYVSSKIFARKIKRWLTVLHNRKYWTEKKTQQGLKFYIFMDSFIWEKKISVFHNF